MDVHASPAKLPELQECLGAFQVRFRRPEGRKTLERYTTGLLTELPTKNGATVAQAVPGTSAQRLQEFLTHMPWDEEDLNRQRVAKMMAEATRGDGVLVFDDTGFPKQGSASVGVERQYSGILGKVGNCQVAVRTDFPVCAGGTATSPVWRSDERLRTVPRWQWHTIRCRRGTTGWLRKKFVAVRGRRVTSDGQWHEGWLLGERATRGQLEEPRYYWSNLPTSASLEDLAGLAHRRHAIEQFHEEDKGGIGLGPVPGVAVARVSSACHARPTGV